MGFPYTECDAESGTDVCPKNMIDFPYRMRCGMRYGCLSKEHYRLSVYTECGAECAQKHYRLPVYRMRCGLRYGCLSQKHYSLPVYRMWCGTDVCPKNSMGFPYRMRCGMRYGCFSQTHPRSNAWKSGTLLKNQGGAMAMKMQR